MFCEIQWRLNLGSEGLKKKSRTFQLIDAVGLVVVIIETKLIYWGFGIICLIHALMICFSLIF